MEFKTVLVDKPLSLDELKSLVAGGYEDMVKAVVDLSKGVMAVGAELHVDEEAFLIDSGSQQVDLWGINIHFDIDGDDWIEFDSMINVRPSHDNRSRGVEDSERRSKIVTIVNNLVKR